MDEYVSTIRECFRPMDAEYPPDCHAWDQAIHEFSRWLNGPRPVLHDAVREITGWSEDKLAETKQVFPRNVRAIRSDYDRFLIELDDDAWKEDTRDRGVYLDILRHGLLNIRGNPGNTKQVLAQSDHLDNLPDLLADFDKVELQDYYWNAMRPSYLAQCDPEHAAIFDDLWEELGNHRKPDSSE